MSDVSPIGHTSSRPKLIHLTTADISLELLLGPQLSAFIEAGYDVVGVSAPGPFVGAIEARGVRFIPLTGATRSMNLAADLVALKELVRLFRAERPDIVHTHNPKTGVYGRIAARLAGVPVIVNTVHGLYANADDRLLKRIAVYTAERVAAFCSHRELVQNSEDLTTLETLRIPADRLTLLGNGIDLTRFGPPTDDERASIRAELGLEPSALVVGAIGRLVAEKGYPELFEAWKRVVERHPEAILVVVGPHEPDKADGLPNELIAQAESIGIRFLGLRSDVERLYHAFDVYVLLSHREGFPRSAMEAAASGLPIVATDIRGCRQVVEDGVTGALVPVASPHRAASALIDLLASQDDRITMSSNALAKAAADFDDRQVINTTLSAYAELSPQRKTTS